MDLRVGITIHTRRALGAEGLRLIGLAHRHHDDLCAGGFDVWIEPGQPGQFCAAKHSAEVAQENENGAALLEERVERGRFAGEGDYRVGRGVAGL